MRIRHCLRHPPDELRRRPWFDDADLCEDGLQALAFDKGHGDERLVFDLTVLTYTEDTTRVTVDITPLGHHACELLLTHELGDSETARLVQDATSKGWSNMLALMERELFPRRVGVQF